MRYIKVSSVPLFLLLSVFAALPAHASDDFEDWALKKGGELDGRWTRAVAREAGLPAANPAPVRASPLRSTAIKANGPAFRAEGPSSPAAGSLAGIDGSEFTKRGSQEFLWRSTKERNDPSRGLGKMADPAQAIRASLAKRRLPYGDSEKYRRSTGSSRASTWRRSPKMGTRLSTSGTRRRSASASMTRGATRVRRSANR